jgi:D-alanyl-D-alanine carboxypeptidase
MHSRMRARTSLSSAARRAAVVIVLVLTLGTSSAGLATADSTTSEARPGQDTRWRQLHAALQAVVDAGATGIIGQVDDGHRVVRAAAGKAVLDPPQAARVTDQSRVGSITKTFVATVTLQLVGERKLSLEDSVERWLPGVVPAGNGITVRQLLNHTSGVFDYTEDEAWLVEAFSDTDRVWAPEELVAVATAHPPLFDPGQGWSYSNTNYILAGMILERVTGCSVEDLIERRIARPLHLRDTYLATTAEFRGSHLHGYYPPSVTGAGYEDTSGWAPTWAWAAGALVSTPKDLARFYEALLSGRLLRPALLRQMTDTVEIQPGFGYGLGLYYRDTPCGMVWGHDGGVPGYVSVSYTDRAGRRSAVTLLPTEPDEAIGVAADTAFYTAVCQMFGKPVPAPDPAAAKGAAGTQSPEWSLKRLDRMTGPRSEM